MKKYIVNPGKSEKVDIVFDGLNFIGALLAFSAVKSGLTVAINQPKSFNTELFPELSMYYPGKVNELTKSINNINFLNSCSKLFPHLYFPQRVLFFKASQTINKHLNSITDYLLSRDREWAALPINTNNFEAYKPLSTGLAKGTLAYEYRFDRNWATIELLKTCKNAGVQLISETQQISGKIHLACSPFQYSNYTLILKNFIWPYPNNITIDTGIIQFTFQAYKTNSLVWLYLKNKTISMNLFQREIEDVFTKLKLKLPENFKLQIHQIVKAQQNYSCSLGHILEDPPLPLLHQSYIQLTKNLSKQIGKRITLFDKQEFVEKRGMNAEIFRQIQSTCDDKFDLAKQTGIDYMSFVSKFYRYPHQIDQMIERAYELMNCQRDPVQIWTKTESEQLQKLLSELKEK